MSKIVRKQKNLFGGNIYLDENFRVIGYGQKGPFGEEVLLDNNFRYAGSKQKGRLRGGSRRSPAVDSGRQHWNEAMER